MDPSAIRNGPHCLAISELAMSPEPFLILISLISFAFLFIILKLHILSALQDVGCTDYMKRASDHKSMRARF